MSHDEMKPSGASDNDVCSLLKQIRDDQREALNMSKSLMVRLRIALLGLIVFMVLAGAGLAVFLLRAIQRIDSMDFPR